MSYRYRGGQRDGEEGKGRFVVASLFVGLRPEGYQTFNPLAKVRYGLVPPSGAARKAANARHYDSKIVVLPCGQDTEHGADAALQATKKDKYCS